MMHGEGNAMTRPGIGISPSDPYGERDLGRDALTAGAKALRPAATVSSLIAGASELQKFAASQAVQLDNLALRATDVAARLTGPVMPPPPRGSASNEKRPEASSALDAVHRAMVEVSGPLSSMDDAFGRLSVALDAIENALR